MGKIQHIAETLQSAFEELQVSVGEDRIEDASILIHAAMGGSGRTYHGHDHIFALADASLDPNQKIAALFHDIVYYQVDNGFPKDITFYLSPYIDDTGNEVVVGEEAGDTLVKQLLLGVFDYQPGDSLSIFGGLNEFCSAAVAVEIYHDLDVKSILGICACIEATIPFRGINVGDVLQGRIQALRRRYNLEITDDDIVHMVECAIDLANRDVENFSHSPAALLSNTWRLLPETNSSLRATASYSVSDYRLAIQKMDLFFRQLNPGCIYQQFGVIPGALEYKRLEKIAEKNVQIAREYLHASFVTAAILEALAIQSGGNIPMALLTGDIDGSDSDQLSSFLPVLTTSASDLSLYVLKLLGHKTEEVADFDVHNSPLTLHIYQSLGTPRIKQIGMHALEMVDGRIDALTFLRRLPRELAIGIIKAAAMMARTRTDRLLQLIDEL